MDINCGGYFTEPTKQHNKYPLLLPRQKNIPHRNQKKIVYFYQYTK